MVTKATAGTATMPKKSAIIMLVNLITVFARGPPGAKRLSPNSPVLSKQRVSWGDHYIPFSRIPAIRG